MNAADFKRDHPIERVCQERNINLIGDGPERTAKCPFHDDKNPSFSVNLAKQVWKCHAGCGGGDTIELLMKLDKCSFKDVVGNGSGKPSSAPQKSRGKIVATYPYHDATGHLLFEAVRYEPKDFSQRRPDPGKPGEWIWNLKGIETVLFRLPEVLRDVKRGLPVLICEGEKDSLAFVENCFTATCNPMGAGKWKDRFSEALAGADCVIVPDDDGPGREHAESVAASLHGKAARVRVVKLPSMLNGHRVKDAADYFAAGGDAAGLISLIDAAPDWQPAQVAPTVHSEAARPDDVTAWIRGVIVEALTDSRAKSWEQRQTISRAVVEALAKIGRFYFHAEQRDFESALFFNSQSKRLERIASDSFAAWLSDLIRVNRSEALFRNIFTEIQNAALVGPLTSGILPEAFWASRPGAIFLSNGDGHVARIIGGKVELVDNGTDDVLFPVGQTLAPWRLKSPVDAFGRCSLFRGLHATATHGQTLFKLWSYSLPTNPRSKPPLVLAGDIGSGKTRTLKGEAEFFGLPFVAAKVEETNEDAFWVALDAGGLFTLDNADTRCRWLPDALAAAATDGCSTRRKKYTDADRVILRPRAWLAVTTANPTFASDAGLADRLLVVRMGRREGETSDAALSDEIAAARDAGLSHVAETLSAALADTAPTPSGLNARHPDFAAFAVRIGRALGIEHEAIGAMRAAEQDKSTFCLEHDAVAPVLLAHLDAAHDFEGTAQELLAKLRERDPEQTDRLTAKGLGRRLSGLLPHLEKVLPVAKKHNSRSGLVFTFKTDGGATLRL